MRGRLGRVRPLLNVLCLLGWVVGPLLPSVLRLGLRPLRLGGVLPQTSSGLVEVVVCRTSSGAVVNLSLSVSVVGLVYRTCSGAVGLREVCRVLGLELAAPGWRLPRRVRLRVSLVLLAVACHG